MSVEAGSGWERVLQASVRLQRLLSEVRARRRLSQAALGERLSMNQSEVSRLERRRDLRVSTRRSFVEATGGRLRLLVSWPGEAGEMEVSVPGPRRAG